MHTYMNASMQMIYMAVINHMQMSMATCRMHDSLSQLNSGKHSISKYLWLILISLLRIM